MPIVPVNLSVAVARLAMQNTGFEKGPNAPKSDERLRAEVETPVVVADPQALMQELLPDDPKDSIQPLAPGFSWTYRVKVSGEPTYQRWLTDSFVSGTPLSKRGGPMNGLLLGGRKEAEVRFTVGEEQKIILSRGQRGIFFNMMIDDPKTGKEIGTDGALFWGRWRYRDSRDIAIAELRDYKMLRHFRYLAGEIEINPNKMPSLLNDVYITSRGWVFHSLKNAEEIKTPAGTFKAFVSTFEFGTEDSGNFAITDKLYYAPGVGLVKWTQSENGKELWSAELTSYSLSPAAK